MPQDSPGGTTTDLPVVTRPADPTPASLRLADYVTDASEAAKAERYAQAQDCLDAAGTEPKPSLFAEWAVDAGGYPEALAAEIVACMNERYQAGL